MKRLLPILICFLLINFVFFFKLHGQEADTKAKDPYDLMSEYYEENFNPFSKGSWYVGFAFSLEDRKLENQARLFDKVLFGEDLDYDLTFKTGYFLNDYTMVGGNLIYNREKFAGTVVQESDTINRQRIKSIGTIAPTIKTYFPLTKNNRLSFFNEIGIGFGFGNSLTRDTKKQDEVSKTYTNEFSFTAGISPGITFFAIENFAFEIQLQNLIGYELQISNKNIDDVEDSKVTTNNVNFNIDLLSLNLGLAYYFRSMKSN
jgi:hypothetical protein